MFTPFFQVSRGSGPPLRVGLLLDTRILPRCVAEIIDQIRGSNAATLELVVLNAEATVESAGASSAKSPAARIVSALRSRNGRRRLLFHLYEHWDARHLREFEDPLAPIDCSGQLRHVPSMTVAPERKRFVHRFPSDAVARIRDCNLDVLIRFGFNILRGEILTAARFGVWSYHHGDNDHYRGGPAGFWEVYEGNPLSGAMLQVLSEDLDAGTVLCKCLVPTQQGLSRMRNRPKPYWAANNFVMQKLRELHEHGWDYVQSRVVPPAQPAEGRTRVFTAPTNREMVTWLIPELTKKIARRMTRRPRTRQWRLAMRRSTESLLDRGATPHSQDFRWIEAAAGRAYADPFLIEEAGKLWLFFEDIDCATRRGRISTAEIGDDDRVGEAVPVLERPHHLSYPCVFRDGGDVFMIPETRANGNVELFTCRRFPDRWVREKELFRGPAVDTSVWVQDGLYWFFVTLVEPRGRSEQLWLFFAESLTGSWTPHKANPISTDVRTNRGAGALFRHHGRLIRPSQDGSEKYGGSFAFNEIIVLTPDRYEERPCVKIGPMKGYVGTHTYSRCGQIEFIDASLLVPNASVLVPKPPLRHGLPRINLGSLRSNR